METLELNDMLDHMDLINAYRAFYPKAAEYTFFSSAHEINNTFKKIVIIPSIFSNQNCMKLEINYTQKTGKFTNMWRLNNIHLDNKWLKEDIKRELKKLSWDK